MRCSLVLHPDFRCEAVTHIDVEVARTGYASLVLQYRAQGTIADLCLPPRAEPTRADDLWQHTCFEAFLAGEGAGYFEFNFSPSTQWAAYRFDGYRTGMRPAPGICAIATNMDASNLNAQVTLALGGVPGIPTGEPWRLGLSAVIEETNGRKSWWALAHPPGKPDFHHRDCFALELPRT